MIMFIRLGPSLNLILLEDDLFIRLKLSLTLVFLLILQLLGDDHVH
jgi:hypothetical protein